MASKKNGVKLQLAISGKTDIDGTKDNLYTVCLKKGSAKIEVGQFLAKTEADAKKKAKTVVRAAL